MDIYGQLKKELGQLADHYGLAGDAIEVKVKPLSPREAIGKPEEQDYPIIKGRERLMEAAFRGAAGQAFTDKFGNWQGTVRDLIHMDLSDNLRRAVFVASLNAILRGLGLAEGTVHCKDGDPRRCGQQCAQKLQREHDSPTITMIGYQPRIFASLRKQFMVHVVDMDPDNIGRVVGGTKIVGPRQTDKYLRKADLILATGSTLVNNTIGDILRAGKPTIFYGVTIAGAARLLGLNRYCPLAM
ncbi:MAG: DUF364 domain-containing protein [Planctomycetota bacterium]